ncbi:MAG: PEP-CTERM sorting domain-containing protein [Planctomycetes bacterium]|nr:PEP-CTERM sorting domain-containing protein [Planctomycetota bacterium]
MVISENANRPCSLEVLGTMSPGTSPAEVSFGGDLVLGSRTLIELGGTTKRSQYDELDVTGLASLGGTLDVLLIDGFPPAPGDTFEIITAASILGTFVAESLPTLPGSLEWFVNYSGTSVELISTFAGDFDFDGDVDGDDFLLWQLGGSPDPLSQSDLADWEANYDMGFGPLSGSSATVPEPATFMMLLIGMLALQIRRDVIVS